MSRPTKVGNALSPQSGWQANLELSFEHRAARTVLAQNRHTGPLQVQKALYPEGPDTCHVAVLHPPGGIAAGDSLCVRASLAGKSRALLTTPGATKWYRSEGAPARQQLHFQLHEDAVLEWLPRENILFDDSNISMSLEIALSAHSKYFGWEILSFGRRASGESWRRGTLRMRTCIRRADRVLWSETAHVNAGSGFLASPVGLSGRTVCGTLLVAGYEVDSELLATCRRVQPAPSAARIGLTRLPGVLIARYLGDSAEQVFNYFVALWTVLRPELSAKIACAPRVWAC
ncbi:MAG: urease accessory protein UreD [Steroidobacteraceae bacterium]